MPNTPLQIYHLSDLVNLPSPAWLIDGVLPQNTLAALAASRSAFKTFLAIDWGLCVASGRLWNGHQVAQGKVLHIFGEGGSGVRQRTEAWQIHNGFWLPSPSEWICAVRPIDMLSDESINGLIEAVGEAVGSVDLRLVIIDTLARNQKGDENNTQQMSKLVDQAARIQEEFHCTVLFLHHFGRGGKFRGNSAIDAAFETLIEMDRLKMGDVVKVSCTKQKDADEFDPFMMKRTLVPLDWNKDGSMVLEMTGQALQVDSLLQRVVSMAGEDGITRAEAERVAASTGVAQSSKFSDLWKQAKDQGLIKLAEGWTERQVGAKWVRDLSKLDIAV